MAMIKVVITTEPKDPHNSHHVATMMLGQDGSIALSRYGRPMKMYLKDRMTEYERYRGWDLIFEALRVALQRGDVEHAAKREPEGEGSDTPSPRPKVKTKRRKARAKNKKVSGKPGV